MSNSSSSTKFLTVPPSGGEFKIKSPSKNCVFKIDVHQVLYPNSWSYVNVTVEDNKRNELYAFGDELWSESGRDDEGAWSESDLSFNNKITFPDDGIYYLVIEPEISQEHLDKVGDITIKATPIQGSSVPHKTMGIFALLIAFVLYEIATRTIRNNLFG